MKEVVELLFIIENRGIEAADYANGKGTPIRPRSRSRGNTDVRVSLLAISILVGAFQAFKTFWWNFSERSLLLMINANRL